MPTSLASTTLQAYKLYDYDFDLILNHAETSVLFFNFAVACHNAENVMFYQAIQTMHKIPTKEMPAFAHFLYDTFVKEHAKKELNVPQSVKDKCWSLIEQDLFVDAFTECYHACYLYLKQVFAHFRKSEDFELLLKKKDKTFLSSIGKLKTQSTKCALNVQDLEKTMLEKHDLNLIQELLHDYDEWTVVQNSAKGNLLQYSNRVFQTHDALSKYGYMVPLKHCFTLHAKCSLEQVVNVLSDVNTIQEMHSLKNVQLVQQCNSAKHPSIIVQGTVNMGPLIFTPRSFVESWTWLHDAAKNQYILVRKTIANKSSPFVQTIQMHAMTVLSVREVVPFMFHVEHVSLVNMGGNLETTPESFHKLKYWFTRGMANTMNRCSSILQTKLQQQIGSKAAVSFQTALVNTIHKL